MISQKNKENLQKLKGKNWIMKENCCNLDLLKINWKASQNLIDLKLRQMSRMNLKEIN